MTVRPKTRKFKVSFMYKSPKTKHNTQKYKVSQRTFTMNKINLLVRRSLGVGGYLSLGLLLSITSTVYCYEEDSVGTEIIKELTEQEILEKTQQEIDQELFEIFGKFFDDKDTMPFSKIVGKIIGLLKVKRTTLQGAQQLKCDEIIKSLEKNKYNSNFAVWARILIAPDLMSLMSDKTRSYINGISTNTKIQTLIQKLKNNPHSFF